MKLITTKPTIYLVNLTMKDYLRQKCKYLAPIAKWVMEHGGQPTDVIPFSVEFEEKLESLKEDEEKLAEFLKEIKVKSRLDKIITEGKFPEVIFCLYRTNFRSQDSRSSVCSTTSLVSDCSSRFLGSGLTMSSR